MRTVVLACEPTGVEGQTFDSAAVSDVLSLQITSQTNWATILLQLQTFVHKRFIVNSSRLLHPIPTRRAEEVRIARRASAME